jgi:multiple sugar transport system substrate-binding protein
MNFKDFTKKQKVFVAAGGAIVLVFLLVLVGIMPGRKENNERIDLKIWGIDERETIWERTAARFQKTYPNVRFSYESIDPERYEEELIDALASGKGPDIFMFNSKWLLEHGNKTATAPPDTISVEIFKSIFPKVAELDFIKKNEIYAMPVSIDTLALVYNRDIFDKRGVVFPPDTWEKFENMVPTLRVIDRGNITMPAAAIGGTSRNIADAGDIISLLMMQNGAKMVNENFTAAEFTRDKGISAVGFYTQFSNAASSSYTWNDSLDYSIDSFADEKTAMIFAYADDLAKISAINPFLDMAIAPMPQVDKTNPINFANYWGLGVSGNSLDKKMAWNFVVFATTDKTSASDYLITTGRPPALRSLIDESLNNPDIGVFAKQSLTARSWLQIDDDLVTKVFDSMVDLIVTKQLSVYESIQRAETEITRAMQIKD